MFLEHALAELLLAKDYTPMAATRRRQVLNEFIDWARQHGATQVEEVTRPLVRRYIADLRERPSTRYGGHLAGETQHGRASVVRMFLNFCVREEWLDEKVTRHFEMPKKGKKVTPVFTEEHYKRLVRAAGKCPDASTYLVLRDRALLALLFDTGIRAMEVCSLTLDAVFTAPQERFIWVNGKGRAQREIGVGKKASLALVRYLNRGRPIRGIAEAYMGSIAAILSQEAAQPRERRPLVWTWERKEGQR